jgi:hypothetical protein
VPKLKIENHPNHKIILKNQNSHIPYTYSQTSCTFKARNRDYPVVCAYEIHAYKVHAREMHTCEMHVCEAHTYEAHTYEAHTYEAHTYEAQAYEAQALKHTL